MDGVEKRLNCKVSAREINEQLKGEGEVRARARGRGNTLPSPGDSLWLIAVAERVLTLVSLSSRTKLIYTRIFQQKKKKKKKKTRPPDKAACTQKLLCVPQLFLSCEFIIIITMSRLVRGTHSTGRSNRILRGVDWRRVKGETKGRDLKLKNREGSERAEGNSNRRKSFHLWKGEEGWR